MLNRYRIPLITLLLVLVVLPVAAAERVDSLPAIKQVFAARFEIAELLNGQVFLVGRGEAVGENSHVVVKNIPFGNQAQETLEVVVYNGKTYSRENNDTQWYLEDMEDATALTHEETAGFPVTKIGTVNVASIPTDQYQVWVAGSGTIDHIAIDFFVGQQINHLYQEQVSVFGTDPTLGELRLEEVTRLYDFDSANIAVGPPANAKPRSAAGLFGGNRQLSRHSLVLGLPKVRELAIKRLSN